MAKWNVAEKNGMWKDGRTVTSHGYVLVKVDVDHHLADCRGYAYEHRLIAEQKLGRRLRKGEMVHHINGNKADNEPENFQVVGGPAENRLLHRNGGFSRRLPGEPNETIQCACGCGRSFDKYDEVGRPRRYISGHNEQLSETQDKILALLSVSDMRRRDMIAHFSSAHSLAVALSRLKKKGIVTNVAHGVWSLVGKRG